MPLAIGNHVLVRPDKPKETTQGGIVLPSSSEKRTTQGEVVSVSYEPNSTEYRLRRGQRIHFSEYSGTTVEIGGEKLLVLSKDSVMLVEA